MWNVFLKVIAMFHPPETEDVKLHAAWRSTVAWGLTIMYLFGLFLIIALTTGIPGVIGEIVWAEDVKEKVVENTKQAVDDLQTLKGTVAAQGVVQAQMKGSLDQFLAQTKAAEIRTQALKRCTAATSVERDSYNKEIYRLQREYKALMNEQYDIPRCTEL